MKKSSFFLIASIFLLLSGCQSEDWASQPTPVGSNSLVATIEGQDYIDASRTAVDDSGNVTWITTDELGVYGNVSENVKYISMGNGKEVIFMGDMPEDDTPQWSYYPYDENASLAEGVLTITLPEQYTYTGNSNAPMLGQSAGNNKFSFKHLGGLIRFTLGGGIPDDADRFVITSMGENQPIAGKASFSVEGENVTMSIASDGKQSVSYDVSAIKDAEEFQHFFVPLPVGDYAKLQVSFYKKNSDTPVFTRSLSNLKVGRAEMICMPILNWNTGEQYVLGDKTEMISPELEMKATISQEKKTTIVVSDIAEENLPKIGTILLKGEVSSTFPEGFLGKVISITKDAEGKYIIETEPVPLDVAFKSLYIEQTVDLYPESSSRASDDIEQDIEGFYVFTKKIEYEGEDDGFNASLEMSLGLKLDVVINTEAKVMYFALRDKIKLTGELSVKKDFDEEKKIPIGPAIPLPTITVTSPVIITPAVQLYAVLKASGDIEMCTELTYESRGRSWVRYRSEAWEGDTDPRESEDSPWNAKGSVKMNGELFTGCSADFYGTFYGIDFLSFGIETEVGTRLFGNFNIESIQNEDLGFVGINGGLNSQFELNGYFHIDANIFENELSAEIPLLKRTWGDCFLYVFPTFTDLQAKVNDDELQAEISTEVTEKLLSKESQISLALIDVEGNVKEESEPIVYENPPINKAEQTTPITTTFEKLEEKTEYKSSPIIQSPLLEDIVPEGKLELKYLSVSFKTKGSLRDQLVQLYKDAGGENWTNNENWLSDKPIEEWEGVSKGGYKGVNGYYIKLSNNNLIGTVSLSNSQIVFIDIKDNQVENLCVDGCSNLQRLDYENNPLVSIDLTGCENLVDKWGDYSVYNDENLKTLKVSGWKNLKTITFNCTPLLESIDLSGCEKLEGTPYSFSQTNLQYINVSGCKSLKRMEFAAGIIPIKYLNVNGCTSFEGIGWSDWYDSLEELYAKDCVNWNWNKGTIRIGKNLRILDIENLQIKQLNCTSDIGEGQLQMLNIKGCTELESLLLPDNYSADLDVTEALKLRTLRTNGYRRTIDVSKNTELEVLICKVSMLDLSNNTKLKSLNCSDGKLESLDLSNLTSLESVECMRNQITTLNLNNWDSIY